MKKAFILSVAVLGLSTVFCRADEATAPAAPAATAATTPAPAGQPAATDPNQLNPNVLSQNIRILQNERTRVLVLQDLLNREGSQLQQLELQFCKLYKLDVDKFRNGQYQYDPKADKFVEVPAKTKSKKKKS